MGFSVNKKKGAISDINVTPLVDVMLVLLIIFMVTAPLMLNGIKLELQKTKEVNPINSHPKNNINVFPEDTKKSILSIKRHKNNKNLSTKGSYLK